MKPYKMFGLMLFLIFTGIISSQDIEFRLGGTDTSSLLIFNGNGDILQSITGNAVFNFGYKDTQTHDRVGVFNFGNTSGLTGFFNVAGNEYADGLGRDINLIAESIDGGSAGAGSIFLSGGTWHYADGDATPGILELHGGESYFGGNVILQAGIGEIQGGDVKISAGNPVQHGSGGNVIISSGRGSSGGSQGNIILTCDNYPMGSFAPGHVYIYGGSTNYGGGDIVLQPGTHIGNISHGSVSIIGSGTYTGSWTLASDSRYKSDIQPVGDILGLINNLRPVNFNWKKEEFPDKNFSSGRQTGLIAQEVLEVFPELVMKDKDGFMSVDYTKLSVFLLKALQEQSEQIQKLTETVEKLSAGQNSKTFTTSTSK